MAEIYRDKTGTALTFDVVGAIVTKAEFIRGSEIISTVTGNPTVTVPYAVTKTDGPFWVKWYFSLEAADHVRVEEHQIVTPYFLQSELVAWDSDFSTLSADRVKYLEGLIRHIIETYTNTKFGLREGTMTMFGNGGPVMYSDERILEFTGSSTVYSIVNDGYGVGYGLGGGYVDPSTLVRPNNGFYTGPVNIKIPIEEERASGGYTAGRFYRGVAYPISGYFGWASVPEAVRAAALQLAESFTCDESLWRERYIKSVRAADWRFDFSEEAFRSTGSLVADQLLDPYVRIGYAVV
jgi:hypothetical protein